MPLPVAPEGHSRIETQTMIRIALVGCRDATPALAEIGLRLQGARFVAVVDPDDAAAKRTAQAVQAPIRAANFAQLLRDHADAFDAIVVRRGDGSSQAVAATAVAAGKHVLLDMALLLHAPQDNAAGVTFMLGQTTRFLPAVDEVKRSLRSGALGSPGLVRIHDWKPPSSDHTETRRAALESLLPSIDLANWVFEMRPTEVYAVGHAGREDTTDSRDYVQVHLGYADDGMALVDHSATLPPGSGYFSLSVIASTGAAYADDHRNVHLLFGGGRPAAMPTSRGSLHYLAELQEFVDAVETGRPPATTLDDGQRAVEVVRAAEQSMETGRAVKWVGSGYQDV